MSNQFAVRTWNIVLAQTTGTDKIMEVKINPHEMLNITDENSEQHSVLTVAEPVAIGALGVTSKSETGEALISTTTAATLLPEHGGLVLVETSRGNLLLSVNGDTLGTVSYTDADIQGRQILTTALPMTGILTQNGLVESQGTTLLINQPPTPGEGAVVCEGTFEGSVTPLQTDQIMTPKSPLTSTSSSGDQSSEKQKRRGGWPKGKRRKPAPDFNTPRAPASGYLLYAIERRQEIKGSNPEIPFSEVTKILGQEWSAMPAEKKQKYLNEADNDKKRYKEELKTYQNTVKKKKMKTDIRGEDGEWESEENYSQLMSVDMEEDDLNELYCRICDKYFSSQHNKKEHMLGRQHVQNMAGEIQKDSTTNSSTLSPTQRQVPPDLGNDSNQSDSLPVGDKESPPLDIGGFIQNFIQDNYERELELQEIRKSFKHLQEENLSLYKQINELKIYQNKLEDDTTNHKAIGANISAQTDTLKMVLTLFGVINFQG